MFRTLLNDESGIIVSAELILLITLAFCSAATGWAAVSSAVVHELNDVSEMAGVVDQSYNVTGIRKSKNSGKPHAECSGFGFNDRADDCDCMGVQVITTCGKSDPGTVGAVTDSNVGG